MSMLRNVSSNSRISYEARGDEPLEKALASRLSFEPNRWSCFPGGPAGGSSSNLAENAAAEYDAWREHHPCALEQFDGFVAQAAGKLVAVFLDYDGTLTPIVSNPDAAFMSDAMRATVRRLAQLFPTAIISGRGREKVEGFVQLRELYYAGSHGMDIVGPQVSAGEVAEDVAFQAAAQFAPLMDAVFRELEEGVAGIPGSSVEHNKFCVSVHFRNCAPADWPAVVAVVDGVAARHAQLKITRGRKVLEVRPQVDWDKGSALAHLMGELGLADPGSVFGIYVGDDRTDEDAFRVLAERQLGVGILVSTKVKPTAAAYTLRDPADVGAFLGRLVDWGLTPANLWHVRGGCKGWAIAPALRLENLLPSQLFSAACGEGSNGSGDAGCGAASEASEPAAAAAGGGGGASSGASLAKDLAAALAVGDATAAAAALLKDGYRLPSGSSSGGGGGGALNGRCQTAAAKLMASLPAQGCGAPASCPVAGPGPLPPRPPPSPRQDGPARPPKQQQQQQQQQQAAGLPAAPAVPAQAEQQCGLTKA